MFFTVTNINIGSTRTRSIFEHKNTVTNQPSIESIYDKGMVTTVIDVPKDDDEKMEIIVDEPRTVESEKHWSKFSKATGYKVIWSSDKKYTDNHDEVEKKDIDINHDKHDGDGEDNEDNCESIEHIQYFVKEIDGLKKMESNLDQDKRKVVKTLRCGIMGLSKLLEGQDEEVEDWTDEKILPMKEINRLERKIADQENFQCNCSIPQVGDVLHGIYTDPFLHEKRVSLYKNIDWSSTIGDLRSTHVKVKHLYYQLNQHHNHIERLLNVSVAMSHQLYQWKSKQMDIVIKNSRRVNPNLYYRYNRG